jgi:hypothetical protein
VTPLAEFDRLSASLFVWHRHDPEVKADLFSTGLGTAAGIFLIDPFAVDMASLADAIGGAKVAGIVLSNANHARSCVEFAEKFAVPIFALHEGQAALHLAAVTEITDGTRLSDEVTVVNIEGAASGEIALHCASEGGTAIIGDALINFGAHGFTFLPGKYCSNARLMRRSLRRLLDYRFERLLFAHGMPILEGARSRLEELLDQGR